MNMKPEMTAILMVVIGMGIAAGWAILMGLQYLAAQLGWWGLAIPSGCFTAALFGRELLNWWRIRRAARERARQSIQRLLVAARKEPLVTPREAARVRPILLRSLRTHFDGRPDSGPNGPTKHQRNKLP